jgi:lysophospholipase L1-like esterase
MKMTWRTFFSVLVLLTYLPSTCITEASAQASRSDSNESFNLPMLFVIGDSISIQYGPYLEKYVQGVWRYERKSDDGQAAKNLDVPTGANGGDSRMVLEYLRLKLNDKSFSPDVLLLNCGLHDIKRHPTTNAIQVAADDYRHHLETIIQLVQARGIALIWMRTTPVEDERHNSRSQAFKRYARDLDEYNRIADGVMAQHRIPTIDLYTFTKSLGSEHFIDHVHYDEAARALQAAHIAGFLRAYTRQPASK